MALFSNSQTTVSGAIVQIADSAGASADAEMLNRSLNSLNAAIKYFNARARWNWLWTEATPISVSGAFNLTGVTASAGQSSALAPSGHGLSVDDFILGSGFAAGTRVTATGSGSFGVNQPVTGFTAGNTVVTVTAGRDMYALPSDYKDTFTARMLSTNGVLRPVPRRLYDRTVANEYDTSTPQGYDLFMVGSKGKIRLLPPPAANDIMQIRYFRYMATASASGSSATLDIPADYDPYLIAWAKWHFLTDKGEGRMQQAQTWFALAKEGLTTMLRDQTIVADEDLIFRPGASYPGWGGDRTTRDLNWTYEMGG